MYHTNWNLSLNLDSFLVDETAATGEEPPVPLMCSMYFNMS